MSTMTCKNMKIGVKNDLLKLQFHFRNQVAHISIHTLSIHPFQSIDGPLYFLKDRPPAGPGHVFQYSILRYRGVRV